MGMIPFKAIRYGRNGRRFRRFLPVRSEEAGKVETPMKAMLMALGVTAAFAAGALTQDREPKPRPNGTEGCEVRAYLLDQNKNAAPLRTVTAAIVVPGKNGMPDRSTPMIIEVPLKADAPREDAKPSRPQTGKVEGTSFTVEVMAFKHVPASGRKPGEPEGRPSPPSPREGPYFRAILDKTILGEDGAFWLVFTIDGEKRVAKGFSCHVDGAKARNDVLKHGQDLERAVAAKDAERAKIALDSLGAALATMPGEDPHRDVCASAHPELRTAIDAGDWEKAERGLEKCREARAECAEKCAPAPPDERKRP